MSTKPNTSVWFSFFKDAGIEATFCTKYTKIFEENTVTKDELLDLDREILREMEITPMGHILKILKHARKFHEQSKETEKESNKSASQSPVTNNNNVVTSPAPPPQPTSKTTPKKESLEKSSVINNKVDIAKTASNSAASTSKTSLSTVVKSSVSRSTPPQTIKQSVVRVVSSKLSSPSVDNKVRTSTISDTNFAEKKMIVLNKRSAELPLKEEVPFQKKIRVLPAHEGKYTIKMPAGTTPRTQKLVSGRLGPSVTEQNSTEKKSNSVFERLGDSRVSSSTEVKQETNTNTTAKSRQERSSSSSESSSKASAPSVFDRLGDRSNTKKLQDDALNSKALLKTKFEVRQEVKQKSPVSPPPPPKKPIYDSKKAYMEKTLTTVHSSLYGGPSSVSSSRPTSSSRLKSEIITPVQSYSSMSSASSSSRLISTRPSSSSTSSSSSSYSHSNQPSQRVQRNETIVRFKGIDDSFDDRNYRPSQSLGHYDGEVLRTERVPSSKNKGKIIIKKYIYKKKVPSKPETSDDELPDNIDDPLAEMY